VAPVPTYDLPEGALAQVPADPRDAARLLVDRGPARPPEHRRVAELAELLGEGDVLVVNESRVLPARLRLRKDTGGAVEVLLVEPDGDGWVALVRPSRRVPPGTRLVAGPDLAVEVGRRWPDGGRRVRLVADDQAAALAAHGEVPLPPYIRTPLADPERYQTVYARTPGSVAAPTAGLHLTHGLLDRCRARGVAIAAVDLAVGLATFRPLGHDDVDRRRGHAERYRVPPATLAACSAARRVVAAGTTTVRALETAAMTGEPEGRTRLLIGPGHPWTVVDMLLTNFHLPGSSLLLLVEGFIGPRWRPLYRTALAESYRVGSFGDAMLLSRAP
jgi:S-adenosylmethionine:tRNA ribosyltransferase-isomerase